MGRSEHPFTANDSTVRQKPPGFQTSDPKPATARTMGVMQTADGTDVQKPGIGHAIQALGGIVSKPPVSATAGASMDQGTSGVGAMTPAPVSATWQGGPKPMTTASPNQLSPDQPAAEQPEVPSENLDHAPQSGFRVRAVGRE